MTARRRRGVYVGQFENSHLAVEVLRVYPHRVRCRVVEPGEFFDTVQDFHPDHVRIEPAPTPGV